MDTDSLTFDKLPEAMGRLLSDVAEIKDKMAKMEQVHATQQMPAPKQNPREVWMGVKELIAFLPQHPAQQTIYDWVYYDKVPYRKIRKYLIFNQAEIEYWLKTDQVMLFDDLNIAAAKAVEKIRYGKSGK